MLIYICLAALVVGWTVVLINLFVKKKKKKKAHQLKNKERPFIELADKQEAENINKENSNT